MLRKARIHARCPNQQCGFQPGGAKGLLRITIDYFPIFLFSIFSQETGTDYAMS